MRISDWSSDVCSSDLEALAHIAAHASHHTDAIITEDAEKAERFLNAVDSAIVMWNASTQFADGGELGLGAEIGISTGRLHARCPVALDELTTYKWLVSGTGQARPELGPPTLNSHPTGHVSCLEYPNQMPLHRNARYA